MSTRIDRLRRLALAAALTVGTAIAATGSVPVTGAEVGPNDDFQVSQATPSPAESHVAYNATDEEYLVVWSSVSATLDSSIWGRIIDARTGLGVGSEFLIAALNPADPTDGYIEPDVVWNSVANEFAVVFAGDATADTGLIVTTFEIYAQRVTAAGATTGALARVSDLGTDDTNGSFDANQPAIAHNPVTNQYLVVWDGDDDTAPLVNGEDEIFGQLLDADLTEDGGDTRLSDMGTNGVTSSDARGPAVAYDGSSYVVVWEGDDDSVTFEIHGQYVNADGTESGSDFLISTDAANDEAYDADVAANSATGDAMVVWEHDNAGGNDFEIEGTIVNGTPGTSFQISETGDATFTPETPAVAYQPGSNTFSVVWTGDHTGVTAANEFEVFHAAFSAAGAVVEVVEQISEMGTDGVASTAVRHPDIAAGPETAAGVVWSGEDGASAQVYGQFVSVPADLEVVSKALTSTATPAAGDPVVYVITYINNGPADAFDVRITDPIPADVTINNVSSTGATLIPVVGENLAWDIASLPSGSGGTITLTGVLAATAVDGALIDNTATISSGALGGDSIPANDSKTVQLTVDEAPSVTIDQGAAQADPTTAGPVVFDVVFSEDVTGFDSGADVAIGGTAPGALTALITPVNATDYTVTVSGMTGDGTITASIPAAVANDTGPNTKANTASTSTDNEVTYDATAPTVTVDQGAAQVDPANTSPIVFDVMFDEDVTGFDETDIGLGGTAGATTAVVTPVTAAAYTVEVSGMTSDGTVTATIAAGAASDAAGNGNAAGTSTDNEVTYDATAPTVTVDQGAAQTDSANTSPIVFDVVYSEPVGGFTDADVTLSGTADATTAIVAGAGDTYTVSVTGMTGDGTVIVDIPADSAVDAAINGNEASTSVDNVVTYIAGDPTPGVNDPPAVTAPSTAAAELATAQTFTGADAVSITDPDAIDNDIIVTLAADDAETVVSVTVTTGLVVTGNESAAVSLTGAQSDINAALATLAVTANNVGDVTITVAADDQGNTDGVALTDSADIVVTVADTTPPTLTVPTGITVPNDPGQAGANVTFAVTVDDPGSEPPVRLIELQVAPTVACSPTSGSFFSIGDTTVTCTATDASGNAIAESFVVTVVDDEDPVISGTTNQTFTLLVGTSGPVTYTAPTATDNSGSPTVVCSPASGSTMSVGANTIRCSATDATGNTATTSFAVTVAAQQIPITGGNLTMLPWALALLAFGAALLAAVGINRRWRTTRSG